ncbi:MAG TPA: non-canonical purine NTP pyrophosphatase [Anaeromyxobacteraceae bacterium]|nr:non-canonical purine NTP pyrophosphatase [Anaeromyxobacteraceae bacterium]
MELFFGTTNPGKLRELRRLVAGLPVRVVSPEDLGRALPEVEEDGDTFEENAAKKAVEWARFSGLHAVADDSGLCVDALGGAPGVRSARWSEEVQPGALPRHARDEANNDLLLARLAEKADDQRGAEYRAVLVLASPDGGVLAVVRGVCRGRIGRARRGTEGFGYDPLFVPEAQPTAALGAAPVTMAEMAPAAKDAISHRGAAFRLLLPYVARLVERSAP